jgi:hypothetical protein
VEMAAVTPADRPSARVRGRICGLMSLELGPKIAGPLSGVPLSGMGSGVRTATTAGDLDFLASILGGMVTADREKKEGLEAGRGVETGTRTTEARRASPAPQGDPCHCPGPPG